MLAPVGGGMPTVEGRPLIARALLAWVEAAMLGEVVKRDLGERALDPRSVEAWAQAGGLAPGQVARAIDVALGRRAPVEDSMRTLHACGRVAGLAPGATVSLLARVHAR